MKPHAFIAMPFGVKTTPQGQDIDFNRVYAEYIKPSVEAAKLEVFRADEELRAGEIRKDMFQELLLADLVVADLSIHNPNVWYELGVRHALRARGVVLVCGGKVTTAFDLHTNRKLRYRLKGDGPDPATLEEDQEKLTKMIRATMESWHGHKISPVYDLMPNLQEPNWKSLRVGGVEEFWQQYDLWKDKVTLASQANPPLTGDILVLSEEAPVAAFRAEAWISAGMALLNVESFEFALEQLNKGLEIDPTHLKGLQKKGICLQRLALLQKQGYTLDRVRQHCQNVLKDYSNDSEVWSLLARVEKDGWTSSWNLPGLSPEQKRQEAQYEDARLESAIASYTEGYRRNPQHYYSGINALTLMYVYDDLNGGERYSTEKNIMLGAVRFAASCETNNDALYWAKVTLGDLEVLVGSPDSVGKAYREAVSRNKKDWFALRSSLSQLELLRDLDFRPEQVRTGIETFERAIDKFTKPTERWAPRQVFLFSGHMIDAKDRESPRFPNSKAASAGQKIEAALVEMGAGPEDLALTQGACGGDLLFTEACQKLGLQVQWMQPFDEAEFIQRSVDRGGQKWRDRYYAARQELTLPIRSAPQNLGQPPPNYGESYPYERCNFWLLNTALSYGIEKVRFICLWNSDDGDGSGGTAHMYKEVRNRTGQVKHINSAQL